MNAKDTIKAIKAAKTVAAVNKLVAKDEDRKTVLAARDERIAELTPDDPPVPTEEGPKGEQGPVGTSGIQLYYQEVNGEFLCKGFTNADAAESFFAGGYGHVRKGKCTTEAPKKGSVVHQL